MLCSGGCGFPYHWFDISWPPSSFSSSTAATCILLTVPKLFSQAVLVVAQISTQGDCAALSTPLQMYSSNAMSRLGKRGKLFSTDDAAWYSGVIAISHSSQYALGDTTAVSEGPSLIGPIGPALRTFPQQLRLPRSHVRSSSAMFSLQFPHATQRGVLSVSDMSSKECGVLSLWDLVSMIRSIKKSRRPSRRRSLRCFWNLVPSPSEILSILLTKITTSEIL